MTFYLLGGGRMAHFAGTRLHHSGHQCLGTYSRNPASVNSLAQALSAPVLNDIQALTENADICLLAVSDDAIATMAQQVPLQKGTVCHFSGTIGLDVLAPHPNRAVCWPVYSIGTVSYTHLDVYKRQP